MKIVYLDNNATTATAPEVVEAAAPYWTEVYGNPSSAHSFGGNIRHAVDEARGKIAALLGATPAEILFTSGGSESDNLAIRGALEALDGSRRHIITTRVEHPAVLATFNVLKKQGYWVTELGVDGHGMLDLAELEAALNPQTALVSIMWANNETGVVFPIAEIASLVTSKGVLFHTDAVQAVGKLPIDLSQIPVDFLSLSGHKLHGPKGIGALYVRRGRGIRPIIHGGHQEGGKRAGTENVPAIVGLGEAAELCRLHFDEEVTRVRSLRDRLEKEILETCTGASINGKNRLPNTLNVSFEYIEGEAILLRLDDLGICASSGSACTSGSLEPSHVMRAMGVPFTRAHGSIRFSFSRYNTDSDVDWVVEHMAGIVEDLRALSPFVG